jgi:Raf kinase inhibitor-like YbhB/YbcL family protein
MKITSSVFKNKGKIPAQYTCDGENISPPLEFLDLPSQAKSFALIMDDPDAPAGIWNHWLIWQIQPGTTGIQENSLPQGAVEGENTSGKIGYSGPCPPSGSHRYIFKLYALNDQFDLKEGAKKQVLEKALQGHVLEEAQLIGFYR